MPAFLHFQTFQTVIAYERRSVQRLERFMICTEYRRELGWERFLSRLPFVLMI